MDPRKASELIFGFDEQLLYGFTDLIKGYVRPNEIKGVTEDGSDWFKTVVDRGYWQFRGDIEDNTTFKQIIPYVVIQCADRYFTYRRKGAEGRLTGKYSIGIGGHLNPQDYLGVLADIPSNGAKREFWEEIHIENGLPSDYMLINSGFKYPRYLYDPSDPVGRVHFGVVYIINVSKPMSEKIRMKEEGDSCSWKTLAELQALGDDLEGWSKMTVNECLSKKK